MRDRNATIVLSALPLPDKKDDEDGGKVNAGAGDGVLMVVMYRRNLNSREFMHPRVSLCESDWANVWMEPINFQHLFFERIDMGLRAAPARAAVAAASENRHPNNNNTRTKKPSFFIRPTARPPA